MRNLPVPRIALLTLIVMICAASQPAMGGNDAKSRDNREIETLDQATRLIDHVLIDAKVVRLGDLFRNAGEHAEAAIAYAPDPGKRAVFDARWLYRVAHAYKLDWQPLSARTEAVIERASISIPMDDIKAQILYELADQGVTEEMDIEFATRFQELYLPAGAEPVIRIENMNFQPRTGRFSAIVVAGQGAEKKRMRMTGRAFRTVEVPVLKSRILRGDIITEDNLEWVKMKAERVQSDVIVDATDLIGKTPKRGMRAGQPVRGNDVTRPILVAKNSLVMVIHSVPNMMLTAQGKALENGAEGDVVQIKNARSNQVIEAEVIGPGRVVARTLSQQISLNLN
jgi:flagella basal body P-ring formation protein FlgA